MYICVCGEGCIHGFKPINEGIAHGVPLRTLTALAENLHGAPSFLSTPVPGHLTHFLTSALHNADIHTI